MPLSLWADWARPLSDLWHAQVEWEKRFDPTYSAIYSYIVNDLRGNRQKTKRVLKVPPDYPSRSIQQTFNWSILSIIIIYLYFSLKHSIRINLKHVIPYYAVYVYYSFLYLLLLFRRHRHRHHHPHHRAVVTKYALWIIIKCRVNMFVMNNIAFTLKHSAQRRTTKSRNVKTKKGKKLYLFVRSEITYYAAIKSCLTIFSSRDT